MMTPLPRRLSARTKAALAVERLASETSRRLGKGSGEMIGGKLALQISPRALAEVGKGRPIACVSATNGKTTTTRLLARALGTLGPVKSNSGGANMAPGVLAALSRPPYDAAAALEVDEIWLPKVAREVQPRVVLLLNISRDQLDRSNETRRIAAIWRDLGEELEDCTVVANVDDPLVTWAAMSWSKQVWVSVGQNWTADAMVCPQCAKLLHRNETGWWSECGLARPEPIVAVTGPDEIMWFGHTIKASIGLPGRVNLGNATMAAAAARQFGVQVEDALAAMTDLGDVQGRYQEVLLGSAARRARMLLAKNPAGWVEMMELINSTSPRSLIVDFNSQTADGRDPSWIWDVPFERLAGRPVLVTGERKEDMSVRLAYAGVLHSVHQDAEAAADAATEPVLDVVANYTAFRDLLVRTAPAPRRPRAALPAPARGGAR
ncbi:MULTISPECIES: MurT ligase domain-containing protein [unclassified Pseudofrankia]|uniref:Mur ligase family protein n=1 Tax=unclassified Pseudofrankia TaxID=2994372 RepID=UPI0008D9FD76|nr:MULTISPECIES: MurT ligase domain-containing protein [unclassified Pseudofrankia]MDT3439700.1 MurT ligase domain-containing protein [Pseudofrankia sp. BMG5.37]OHV44895.1 Mur ligase [Pseudofrankia sp. BMG5.36]